MKSESVGTIRCPKCGYQGPGELWNTGEGPRFLERCFFFFTNILRLLQLKGFLFLFTNISWLIYSVSTYDKLKCPKCANTKLVHLDWIFARAAEDGDLRTVRLLALQGVDINGRGQEGETALCAASEHGHREIVAFLLEKGADVNAANSVQWTPLMLAVSREHDCVAEMLLTGGADARAASNFGWTALHSACEKGEMGVLQLLLRHGADINARDYRDETPLSLAQESGHAEIVLFLKKNGAE